MSDFKQMLFLPDSMPYEMSFGKWTEKWWKWLLSIPKPTNPAADTTGQYCGRNQAEAQAWFLAGSLGASVVRQCTIPKEKSLLFPIIVDEQSFAEKPDFKSDSELEALVKNEADKVSELNASIDGIQVPDLRRYRVRTESFHVVLPANNIWNVNAGPTRAAADGYWLFLRPLAPGRHKIHFSGKGPHFFTETTYRLSVGI